jgi:hypothetical protein
MMMKAAMNQTKLACHLSAGTVRIVVFYLWCAKNLPPLADVWQIPGLFGVQKRWRYLLAPAQSPPAKLLSDESEQRVLLYGVNECHGSFNLVEHSSAAYCQ